MTAQEYRLEQKKTIIEWVAEVGFDSVHFIGLDKSLKSTGFSVVKAGKYVAGREIGSRYYGAARLKDLATQVIRHAEQYSNPIIINEDYAFASDFQAHQLGELGGVLAVFLMMRNIRCLYVSPPLLKKYVLKKGNAKKNLMPMGILKKFGIEAIGGDHADATGLAFFGYNAIKFANDNSNIYTINDRECFDAFLSLKKKEKKKKKGNRISHKQMALQIDE